jgi:hypothetical protein
MPVRSSIDLGLPQEPGSEEPKKALPLLMLTYTVYPRSDVLNLRHHLGAGQVGQD